MKFDISNTPTLNPKPSILQAFAIGPLPAQSSFSLNIEHTDRSECSGNDLRFIPFTKYCTKWVHVLSLQCIHNWQNYRIIVVLQLILQYMYVPCSLFKIHIEWQLCALPIPSSFEAQHDQNFCKQGHTRTFSKPVHIKTSSILLKITVVRCTVIKWVEILDFEYSTPLLRYTHPHVHCTHTHHTYTLHIQLTCPAL